MSEPRIHSARAAQLLASPRVVAHKPPRDVPWPIPHPEPPDLAALYAACDGLVLDGGLVLFGRGELGDVTQWLVLEKGLGWPDDFVVVGERRDTVVVLDLDARGERAGGGVLEAGADDLGALERVASDVVSYALVCAGAGEDPASPPEIAARAALASEDAPALHAELARPFYPGQARLVAALAFDLGVLWLRAGAAERALEAFERSAASRAAVVARGGQAAERSSAWRAAAHAARERGDHALATECERRGNEESGLDLRL
jgi:hypothetical protein